ncbi:MAG: cell division protein FtsZ [Hungatella sp.]
MIDLLTYIPEAKKKSSNITVIGVGGGGSNAVDYMYRQGIRDVEFIICNTDLQALNAKNVPLKITIGDGLGAGANPVKAEKYAEDGADAIRNAFRSKSTKMAFITACMGGGTGTGAAPVIAKIAREMDILAVGIVTMPLKAEGPARMKRAKEGLIKLKENLDAILIIDNTMVLKIFGDLTWEEAFHKADDILSTGAKSLAEILIKDDYHLNADFNDVRKTMLNTGFFLMGTATAKSANENVVDELINATLQSPLLMQNDITGAKNILLSLTNGADGFLASKTEEVLDRIQQMADGEAEIIAAIGVDTNLQPDEVKLIILATGFDSSKAFKGFNLNLDVQQKVAIPLPINVESGETLPTVEGEEELAPVRNEDMEVLRIFEETPAYMRLNRDIYHHIDPNKQKIVKLNLSEV